MNRSIIEAMSNLEQANPLEGALSWWTPSDEDALLAAVLADHDAQEYVPSDDLANPAARPKRLMRAALVGLGIIAVGSVALIIELIGSNTPSAFAAWTPTTTMPPASQLATATSSCQSRYTLGIHLLPPNIEFLIPNSLPPLVVTDSRGPFEMLVYAGPLGEGVCLWGSSGVLAVGGGNGETLPPASDLSIGVPGVGFVRNGGSVLTYADGNAGARVTAVTLDLANGVRVKATVQNGYYAAWWPSRTDVTATEVTTSEGTHHQGVGDIGPNNNGPGSSGVGP
jgi:hypothetical protein